MRTDNRTGSRARKPGPEAALDSTMTAGKGDLHRESSGIIVGDDLVIAHSSKYGTAAAPFQSWVVSQFENSPYEDRIDSPRNRFKGALSWAHE